MTFMGNTTDSSELCTSYFFSKSSRSLDVRENEIILKPISVVYSL